MRKKHTSINLSIKPSIVWTNWPLYSHSFSESPSDLPSYSSLSHSSSAPENAIQQRYSSYSPSYGSSSAAGFARRYFRRGSLQNAFESCLTVDFSNPNQNMSPFQPRNTASLIPTSSAAHNFVPSCRNLGSTRCTQTHAAHA